LAEILDGESGEKDLKIALDQLRDDQISQYLRCICILFYMIYSLLGIHVWHVVTRDHCDVSVSVPVGGDIPCKFLQLFKELGCQMFLIHY